MGILDSIVEWIATQIMNLLDLVTGSVRLVVQPSGGVDEDDVHVPGLGGLNAVKHHGGRVCPQLALSF